VDACTSTVRLGLLLLRRCSGWSYLLGSLGVLFLNAFWSRDPFTALVVREFTLDNFDELLTTDVYRTVTIRTVTMALSSR
jgi:putative spermidine/putrescine transport system permease protein